MAGERVYRSKYWRLTELDRRIRAGDYPNASAFAREWEVSRKTIQRDIDFLRYGLGAPLEFDPQRNGFRYTDTSWSMPEIQLTEGELLQLLLAERMAKQYKGTPLAKTLESVFEKILAKLPDKVSVNPAYVRAQFSFYGLPARPISEEVWLPLFRALRANRVVRMVYKAVEQKEPRSRAIEPVHLACIADEWYLVAYDLTVQDFRTFAVSRIQAVELTDEAFEAREFDPETYFANRFGRFVGKPGQTYRIVIRFNPDAAVWIPERVWHPEQEIQQHPDGSLTLTFPAPALYEVKRWVLQWSAEAEVLEPAELREDVRKEAETMGRKYGGVVNG
jgi:predicted DNA-binding transcriptional regulator YafY